MTKRHCLLLALSVCVLVAAAGCAAHHKVKESRTAGTVRGMMHGVDQSAGAAGSVAVAAVHAPAKAVDALTDRRTYQKKIVLDEPTPAGAVEPKSRPAVQSPYRPKALFFEEEVMQTPMIRGKGSGESEF